MFEKDNYKISMINRDGLELRGYYNKVNSKQCVVAFCGFGGNCDKIFCAIAEQCEKNNISFLFGNTQGSYVRKTLKRHLPDGSIVEVEKGAFNEDFDECVSGMSQWIDYAVKEDFEQLYLIGASIACNRIVNYLNHYQYPNNIKKIILLCPQHLRPQTDINMLNETEKMMAENRPENILKDKFFGYCEVTARTYYNISHNDQLDNLPYLTGGNFDMLKNIQLPIRVVMGSVDEGVVGYTDKSAKDCMEVLKNNAQDLNYEIIEGGRHNFKNKEQQVGETVIKYVIE